VLERLNDMPTQKRQTVGNLSVVADPPYAAASGRTCRRVTLTSTAKPQTSTMRLACKDGKAWQFVPSVFLAPGGK
jgi:hypothetical protein